MTNSIAQLAPSLASLLAERVLLLFHFIVQVVIILKELQEMRQSHEQQQPVLVVQIILVVLAQAAQAAYVLQVLLEVFVRQLHIESVIVRLHH